MVSTPLTLDDLKRLKNSVIGNPLAKEAVVEDEGAVRTLIDLLNQPPSPSRNDSAAVSMRVEAAHIVASLAYGSDVTLGALLRHDAPRALIYAISNLTPQDSISLPSSFARALRTISGALADIAGPPLYGIPSNERSTIMSEAKEFLGVILSVDSLDMYLPLLSLPGSHPAQTSPISASIAQLIAISVRSSDHRKTVVEWVPPGARKEKEGEDAPSTSSLSPKKNRGWEKPAVIPSTSTNTGIIVDPVVIATGGWAVRVLVGLLSAREGKLQEAALEALAVLAMDNPVVALVLSRQLHPDAPTPISIVHSLMKSKSIDVQLSACTCATRVIRACRMSGAYYLNAVDDACVRSILSIVNRVLDSKTEATTNVVKSCFILYHLVTDDRKLSQLAYDRGCLDRLAKVLKDVTPLEFKEGWDESEAETTSKLREAALTALAALSLFNTDIRRNISDTHQLLPLISVSLTCKYTGVRYAGCQVVRMLARAVAMLRTNIVDSGLGMAIFEVFKRGVGRAFKQDVLGEVKETEDRRVVEVALKAVCNIVVEFSPLRPIFLNQGVMPRLMLLIHSEDDRDFDEWDHNLRLNAMWAVKNLLWKSTVETKRDIMSQFGWPALFEFLHDPSEEIQEQAYHIVRNIAENEEGISIIFREFCPLHSSSPDSVPPAPSLLDSIASLLLTPTSPQTVIVQATYVLANLANGQPHETLSILHHARLLEALRTVIAERGSEVRRPAVSCILQLVMERDNARERRRIMVNRGVGETLRRVCEWTPVSMSVAGSGGGTGPGGRRASHGATGVANPIIGWYLHPNDRTSTTTGPTLARNINIGHQRSATSSGAGASLGPTATPSTTGGPSAPHPHAYPHYLPHPTLHHAYSFGAGSTPGMSTSVPSGSASAGTVHVAPFGMVDGTSPPTTGYMPYTNMPSTLGQPTGPGGVEAYATLPAGAFVGGAGGYTPSIGLGMPSGTPGQGVASGGGGTPGGPGIGSIGPHPPLHPAIDVDKEVYDRARRALDWLEHGEGYGV